MFKDVKYCSYTFQLFIKATNLFNATGLGILPAAPLLQKSPLIYPVVDPLTRWTTTVFP